MASSANTTPAEALMDAPPVPDELPFLASISWFDSDYRALDAFEMLNRYEAGWRYLGVLAEPSPAEERFIRALIRRFGSVLRV